MAMPLFEELANLSQATFVDVLKLHSRLKERSQMTFVSVHRPALRALNQALPKNETNETGLTAATIALPVKRLEGAESNADIFNGLSTLLIGDSLFEQLKTLPSELNSLGNHNQDQTVLIGPSSRERLPQQSIRIATIPCSLNLRVGGDNIENVLYHLSLGTYNLLLPHSPHLSLVAVQVGTKNLRPKRSLAPDQLWKYGLLIQALLRIAPKAQILCSGLLRRNDVPDWVFVESNSGLRGVVGALNRIREEGGVERSKRRVRFVEASWLRDEDFVDHVHLNWGGYAVWDQVLWPILRTS